MQTETITQHKITAYGIKNIKLKEKWNTFQPTTQKQQTLMVPHQFGLNCTPDQLPTQIYEK
jgi:hypothetical protein